MEVRGAGPMMARKGVGSSMLVQGGHRERYCLDIEECMSTTALHKMYFIVKSAVWNQRFFLGG